MNSLSHEEAYAELAAVALDAASADVSAAVREHAKACPECGPELVAMEETVAQLGQLVPQRAMNLGHGAGIRSRLLMRARGEREAQSAAAPGPPDLARGVASLTGLRSQADAEHAARSRGGNKKKSSRIRGGSWQTMSGLSWLASAAVVAFVAAGR